MKVEQISIFLENKIGRLAEITSALAKANINIKALSLADTSEFGIVRLIVDNHEEAKAALKEQGFTVGSTDVVAAEVPHSPGGLNHVLHLLGDNGINIEYMYTFPFHDQMAVLVFRFNRQDQAIELLQKNGIRVLSNAEVNA